MKTENTFGMTGIGRKEIHLTHFSQERKKKKQILKVKALIKIDLTFKTPIYDLSTFKHAILVN